MIEWGIVHHASPHELHRGPMTEAVAREWVTEWEADGGGRGAFLVVMREVLGWRIASSLAPCPCGEPVGGPPCTAEQPCSYGAGKPVERWTP